jgi:pimeloyl-ACP methyl ester carboxylesterase
MPFWREQRERTTAGQTVPTVLSFMPALAARLVLAIPATALLLALSACDTQSTTPREPAQAGAKSDQSPAKRPSLFTAILAGPLPAVVFESNLGETWETWREVAPHVAPFAFAFAYTRAGLGDRSPRGSLPRDGRAIALDLHQALQDARIPPPYILVAHSAGALYTRIFAGLFSNEVAGLVWVEPATVEFFDALKAQDPADYNLFVMQKDSAKLPNGKAVPQGVQDEAAAWDATMGEARSFPLPVVPMTVITADQSWPRQARLWWQSHEDSLRQSTDPLHVRAERTGHYVPLTQPDLVLKSILGVLNEYRARLPAGPPPAAP